MKSRFSLDLLPDFLNCRSGVLENLTLDYPRKFESSYSFKIYIVIVNASVEYFVHNSKERDQAFSSVP